MNCCSNCFLDNEIKAIIESYDEKGNCNFCDSENVPIYRIGRDNRLSELLGELLDVYTPSSSLPSDFPIDNTDLLKNILHTKWHVFALEPTKISRLIKLVCAERYSDQPDLFDSPVGILESIDLDYLDANTVLKSHTWADFVNMIKHTNRFHSDFVNKSVLDLFLRCIRKTYVRNNIFYRARVCPTSSGYSKEDMGAPSSNSASPGRVNPEGVSVLYLSNSEETTLYEVRASVSDYVAIGNFKLKEDIEIINIAMIDKISPFVGIANGFDFTQYAVNIEHLRMIADQVSKPLRRQDSHLDYIPTQYISDFIKSKGYNGIEFRSAMCMHGENIAIFDSEKLTCTKVKTYSVKSIAYNYSNAI